METKIKKHKEECFKANKLLISKKLSIQTFGNVSQKINDKLFAIKPSGINLNISKGDDMVLVDILTGKIFNSKYKPSSDTETHRILYKKFPSIKGVAHAHSVFLTSWTQTGKPIPNLGTTHADYWQKNIPITRELKKNEIRKNYELNTGKVIVETLIKKKINLDYCPGILCRHHGAFAWGDSANDAVKNLELMEFIAELAFYTSIIGYKKKISKDLVDKHFFRKHGRNKYYGQ